MENTNNEMNLGVVKISDEVVSVIAAIAASEIKGVMETQQGVSNNISHILKGKKASGKGVKVTLVEDSATIELSLAVEYGIKIPEVISTVQENVKKTVEAMTGLKVNAVDIIVQNIFIPKKEIEDNKES